MKINRAVVIIINSISSAVIAITTARLCIAARGIICTSNIIINIDGMYGIFMPLQIRFQAEGRLTLVASVRSLFLVD